MDAKLFTACRTSAYRVIMMQSQASISVKVASRRQI